jgi:hypothetical protein
MRFIICALWMMTATLLAQTPSREEQAILDLSKKKFDWLTVKQSDSLASMLDDRVQYIHSNGWIQNKNEVIEDLRSGKLNYTKVTIQEAAAQIFHTSAIVTGLGIFDGITDGKPFSLHLRYTEVYIKSGSHWKLVLRHANKMP